MQDPQPGFRARGRMTGIEGHPGIGVPTSTKPVQRSRRAGPHYSIMAHTDRCGFIDMEGASSKGVT